jgi:hypothetical protein
MMIENMAVMVRETVSIDGTVNQRVSILGWQVTMQTSDPEIAVMRAVDKLGWKAKPVILGGGKTFNDDTCIILMGGIPA